MARRIRQAFCTEDEDSAPVEGIDILFNEIMLRRIILFLRQSINKYNNVFH